MEKKEMEKINELEEEIKKLKETKKEIESKYTFKGLYQKLAGRQNILKELQKNNSLSDEEKYKQGVQEIKKYAASL